MFSMKAISLAESTENDKRYIFKVTIAVFKAHRFLC